MTLGIGRLPLNTSTLKGTLTFLFPSLIGIGKRIHSQSRPDPFQIEKRDLCQSPKIRFPTINCTVSQSQKAFSLKGKGNCTQRCNYFWQILKGSMFTYASVELEMHRTFLDDEIWALRFHFQFYKGGIISKKRKVRNCLATSLKLFLPLIFGKEMSLWGIVNNLPSKLLANVVSLLEKSRHCGSQVLLVIKLSGDQMRLNNVDSDIYQTLESWEKVADRDSKSVSRKIKLSDRKYLTIFWDFKAIMLMFKLVHELLHINKSITD